MKNKEDKALAHLAWLRKSTIEDPLVLAEFSEISAAVAEERAITQGASWKECFTKGNPIRFFIAFMIFSKSQALLLCSERMLIGKALQQWSGQVSLIRESPKNLPLTIRTQSAIMLPSSSR